jgi:hypothetical protein
MWRGCWRDCGAIVDHGEAEVAAALSRAMSQERCDLPELTVEAPRPPQRITVPPVLAAYAEALAGIG